MNVTIPLLRCAHRRAMAVGVGQLRVAPACSFVLATCTVLGALNACGGRSALEPGEAPLASPTTSTPTATPSSLPPNIPLPSAGAPNLPGEPMKPSKPVAPACEAVTLTIDELRPAVTLLVDQSGSMNMGYPDRGSGTSRWAIVRQALLAPHEGVVPTLQHSIQFALTFYTSYNGFSGGECPLLSSVSSATGNYDAIQKLYDNTFPADDTPTGAAITSVLSHIREAKRKGPEVLLLVTDGDPDTCEQPDPQNGQLEAVAAAAQAYQQGVDFYVLGISSDISGDKLQQLANAGRGKPLDAKWGVDTDAAEPYQASNSAAGLTQQLQDILSRVPLCEVELERDVAEAELSNGRVTLDGKRLVYGNADGYALKDPRHLQIVGKACDTLRQAGKRLSVRISCQ